VGRLHDSFLGMNGFDDWLIDGAQREWVRPDATLCP